MTWEKVLIVCGLVLLLRVPCQTYNQHTPETLTNHPVISQGLSITDAETKRLIANTRFNPIYAWNQLISNLRTAFHNYIQQDKEIVTQTDHTVRNLINYLSP